MKQIGNKERWRLKIKVLKENVGQDRDRERLENMNVEWGRERENLKMKD